MPPAPDGDSLLGITTILLDFEAHELEEIRRYGDEAYGKTAGLLAALAHCADWEWHRRQGTRFALNHPSQSIDNEELGACLEFIPALSAEFPHAPRVRQLLTEIGRALTGTARH